MKHYTHNKSVRKHTFHLMISHLVWSSVLFTAATGRLFVVFANVHDLPLGALSDQVSAHAGNIFKAVAWQRRRQVRSGEMQPQN